MEIKSFPGSKKTNPNKANLVPIVSGFKRALAKMGHHEKNRRRGE